MVASFYLEGAIVREARIVAIHDGRRHAGHCDTARLNSIHGARDRTSTGAPHGEVGCSSAAGGVSQSISMRALACGTSAKRASEVRSGAPGADARALALRGAGAAPRGSASPVRSADATIFLRGGYFSLGVHSPEGEPATPGFDIRDIVE